MGVVSASGSQTCRASACNRLPVNRHRAEIPRSPAPLPTRASCRTLKGSQATCASGRTARAKCGDTSQGRAREYQLRLRTTFRVVDAEGIELIAPTSLVARRDIAFNESELLAKESEEALLYRDMQSDLVRQIVNRLQGMKPSAS